MQLRLECSFLLLLGLLVVAQAKPTFDKIADVLLSALDEEPHYARPRPRPYAPPHGPLIQEGYDQGYDHGYDHGYEYYYGGGGGHEAVVGRPYAQPPPVYGYYPAPVQAPTKGYYASPQAPTQYQHNYAPPATPSQYQHNHAPSGYSYGHTYGRTAATETESVGGYKHHGY